MVLIMTINSLTRPDDGIDNDLNGISSLS
jgi:hypothetical protein